MSNKCKYDYGFEPYDTQQKRWKGINCAKPFDPPNSEGCNPEFSPRNSGLYEDEESASMECAFAKWSWDGDNPKGKKIKGKSPRKMYTRRRRKGKMRAILREICNNDKDMCPGKVNVSKNKICDETKVCDDVSPSISGWFRDVKFITKIVLDTFDKKRILSKKKKDSEIVLTPEQLAEIEQSTRFESTPYPNRDYRNNNFENQIGFQQEGYPEKGYTNEYTPQKYGAQEYGPPQLPEITKEGLATLQQNYNPMNRTQQFVEGLQNGGSKYLSKKKKNKRKFKKSIKNKKKGNLYMKFNYCVWLIPNIKNAWSKYVYGFHPHISIKTNLEKKEAIDYYKSISLDKPLKVKLVGEPVYEVKNKFHSLYYCAKPVGKAPSWWPQGAHVSFRYRYNEPFSKFDIKQFKKQTFELEELFTDIKVAYCNDHYRYWYFLK